MKNPFKVNPSALKFLLAPPIRLSQINSERESTSWTEAQCKYAAHAINSHDKAIELLRLCYDNIDDDFENRAPRHSMGNLAARIKALLAEEEED